MIKLFAIIFMFIDHFALILLPDGKLYWIMRLLGRLSMPLYAYGIARGCYFSAKKGTFKKYLRNIGTLSLLSQIPYAFIWNEGILGHGFNICFSWFLSVFFIGILLHKKYNNKTRLILGVVCGIVLTKMLFIGLDYGLMGVLMPICMYICFKRCFSGEFKEPLVISPLLLFGLWVENNYIENSGGKLPQLIMLFSIPLISVLSRYDD